jgi:hypothetical protein
MPCGSGVGAELADVVGLALLRMWNVECGVERARPNVANVVIEGVNLKLVNINNVSSCTYTRRRF